MYRYKDEIDMFDRGPIISSAIYIIYSVENCLYFDLKVDKIGSCRIAVEMLLHS